MSLMLQPEDYTYPSTSNASSSLEKWYDRRELKALTRPSLVTSYSKKILDKHQPNPAESSAEEVSPYFLY
jgi:hypothetical protein